jgi:hypothetical protein
MLLLHEHAFYFWHLNFRALYRLQFPGVARKLSLYLHTCSKLKLKFKQHNVGEYVEKKETSYTAGGNLN